MVTTGREIGEPDFGGALQRWLNLERDRIVGGFSPLDQMQGDAAPGIQASPPAEATGLGRKECSSPQLSGRHSLTQEEDPL